MYWQRFFTDNPFTYPVTPLPHRCCETKDVALEKSKSDAISFCNEEIIIPLLHLLNPLHGKKTIYIDTPVMENVFPPLRLKCPNSTTKNLCSVELLNYHNDKDGVITGCHIHIQPFGRLQQYGQVVGTG